MNNVCKHIRYAEEINNKIEINVAARYRGDGVTIHGTWYALCGKTNSYKQRQTDTKKCMHVTRMNMNI